MSSRSRLRIRGTLAFRLTLWYGGIFTVSAIILFFLIYLLIIRVLEAQMDQELSHQASTFISIYRAKGLNAVQRVMILEAQASGERKLFFRLLGSDGSAFSSSNMSYWKSIPINRAAVSRIIGGEAIVMETLAIADQPHQIRILYQVMGRNILLQLGRPLEHSGRLIGAFHRVFWWPMGCTLLFSAILGWFMARKALSGVEEVTRTAMGISGNELEKRVPVKSYGDEVARLAVTFNQMLDRIQSLVVGMREMSDNIAHDLRSPITRIRGMAEVTLSTARETDEYRDMTADVIEECDQLLDMTNTMLTISKTEAGAGTLDRESFDMTSLVRDACDLFLPVAEDRCISMAWKTPESCSFNGDRRLLQRMMTNLIDNAIKYTPSGGWVQVILVGMQGDQVEIAVEDNGIGIHEKDLPHIFERFYRCDPSRTRTGTGLGLSLSKTVAAAHGGGIEVVSAPDAGSSFFVALPKVRNNRRDTP